MYLKRLELKGFKSFPNKTDIIFKEGVTAIVGPNGSGKSNVSDAVRWVLGEQSIKSLRGDKLEDVIFAGSDNQKPMNFCEVALTIDNSDGKLNIDYSEVTIKRRAYRNGESQFYLNNKSCRLKDIKEILLDTGIGKDGYSIIEQGKVDEILSNNPINRRKVFDEACGISKYRYKKTESERNLRNTKENLDRINDIYVEIENQIKPLYNQQVKARKYLDLSEKLKKIEVNNYIREIQRIEKQLSEINSQYDVLGQELKNIDEEKIAFEESSKEVSIQIEEIDKAIEKSTEYINSIRSVIDKKDYEINLLNQRKDNSSTKIKRNMEEVENINKSFVDNKENLEKINKEKEEKEKSINEFKNQISIFIEKNEANKNKIEELNDKIENLKDEIINLLNEKQDVSNKLSTLNANKENINQRNENINLEISEINEKLKSKEELLEEIQNKINSKKEKIEDFKKKVNSYYENLRKLKEDNHNLNVKIQNNNYALKEYSSKLNVYIDMENHYEGFNRGVKEVLKNKNLKGIYGALGQVVTVPQKYEKAIEAALGAYMQNIITSDENSAKAAINYLKHNKIGRVTFLPMNIIKSKKINNIQARTNFIGIASDLISYEEKYRDILENILGRTVVIDNIDEGIKFARETGHKYKVVTLEGEILNPGGSLTGGSLKSSGNILSRKRLINEFNEKIKATKEENTSIQEKLVSMEKEIISCKENIQHYEEEIKNLDKELIFSNSSYSRYEEEINSFLSSIKKLESEKESLGSNLSYTLQKKEVLESQIKDIDDKHKNNKETIETLSKELNKESEIYENEKSKFDNINIQLTKDKEILKSFNADMERIKEYLNQLNNKKLLIEKENNEEENEIKDIDEKIIIEDREKENLKTQLNENNKSLGNKKIVRENLKQKLDDNNLKLKNIDKQFIELREAIFKVESRIEKLESNKESNNFKLFEDYNLTYLQAVELRDDDIEINKKILDSLKKEIRSLGNVNIDSIEEYKETKERYDFYSEQKEDLQKSIEAIEEIIAELEEHMKIQFKEEFDKINENFKYVYNRLFGGGEGNLTILDEENILESDIEITAKPPGKKMKNLSLLSGGEKALTAISILFSILLAKPTPFCILDEIEAPLDDSNIARFGTFLKELTSRTQFIAVTHRRGTMEAADYIYGVTMEQRAISKVIALSLNEAEEMTDII
ncbi:MULTISPECIES: chromosome segregation protein SMC [Terrisporobacter]|uniref:chromosome segregation protein SMC n=1 Tax=Terrisporobacter TaxID=1505652 RepID=UPI00093E59B1|nr:MULTISPECIES: chromosome segregation protein SMC [Terrisporobacter]MCC3668258.1 chromosome segregation protein SMC [Terrisporobacter mayombei]MDY3373373.1 chromosome segregation protein SMC [Terrisporobacter othiniensis]